MHYKNYINDDSNSLIYTIIYLSNIIKNEFDRLIQKHNMSSQLTNMSLHIL
jgi:hypothetical protein